MNPADLCALADAAVSGWVSTDEPPSPADRASRLHYALKTMVRRAGTTKKDAEALKRSLLNHLNAESLGLVSTVLGVLKRLQGSRFRIEVEDSMGKLFWQTFELSDVSSPRESWRVMQVALALRRLSSNEQRNAMRAYELEAELAGAEAARYDGALDEPSAEMTKAQLALAEQMAKLDKARALLSPKTRDIALCDEFYLASASWSGWAVPVEVPVTSSAAELTESSAWYARLWRSMYLPLPLDETAEVSAVRRWKRQWKEYEDCGRKFGVIAAWLKALAAGEGGTRCQICYRYLAAGQRRFCEAHKRTAAQRQDARDRQVSLLYRPLAQRLVRRHAPTRRSAVSAWTLKRRRLAAMLKLAKQAGVATELAMPAATLAAALLELRSRLPPALHDLLRQEFQRLLETANAPFAREHAPDQRQWLALFEARKAAMRSVQWESFFRAVYKSEAPPASLPKRAVRQSLDPDHPMVSGKGISPERLINDLIHLGTWLEVTKRFDGLAYIDIGKLNRLRREVLASHGKTATLGELSKALGASHEAVRQTLKFADGQGPRATRRDRVIADGLRRLKAQLEAEFPGR